MQGSDGFSVLNYQDIPTTIREKGKRTYRSLVMDGIEVEFSEGFTDLHTVSYNQILDGNGFGPDDSKPAIEIVYQIRNSIPEGIRGDYHPILKSITI